MNDLEQALRILRGSKQYNFNLRQYENFPAEVRRSE